MCGRFSLTEEIYNLKRQFEFEFFEEIGPRYNIAPSQMVLAIGQNKGVRKGAYLKWGLVPHWAADPKIGYKMINARSEGIDEKPSFKHPFKQRRCLILSDGFYEWKKNGKEKHPYRFVMKDHKPFALAGLYDVWKKEGQPALVTCTILTTTPNEVTKDVHDRMPVILKKEDYNTWLDPNNQDTSLLKTLLTPYPAEEMMKYEISSLVNSPKYEDPDILQPVNSL
ncbi:SOS response-associated peptidase [Robertmurraya korlensis]|uniref:SOS response-associated peptidase n=1 Tax=Robertmurraya korlensis TaxID=519977 RepID=UPI00204175AC|nr:SOS response-associated peptidase [Robertmurraya korlensis]MCM3601273.1 SOS response-associated peptidase [Robertmurraya korlensis]